MSPPPRTTSALLLLSLLGCGPGKTATPGTDPDTPPGDSPTDSAPPQDTAPDTGPAARVRITEVMYHSVDVSDYEDHYEFIELHNAGELAADLDGWAFDDGISFTFGAVTLAPGETLVVARDRAALLSVYPKLAPEQVLGDWSGGLSNGGERVRLVDADGETVDTLRYDDEAPWPVGADALGVQDDWLPAEDLPLSLHRGRGRSLQRVSLDAPTDAPGSWLASPLDGADPGDASGVDGDGPLPVVAAISWAGGQRGPLPPDTPLLLEVDLLDGPLSGAHLEWFADDVSSTTETVSTLSLVDDGTGADAIAGDGRWSATLPAQPDGTILRFRVADDGGTVSPRAGDPAAWHGRFVGTPIDGDTRPYQIFIDPDQWTTMWDLVSSGRVSGCDAQPGWEARVPAVFVYNGDVFDVLVRYQGSRWNRTNGRELSSWSASGPERPAPLRALSWSIKFPRYAPLEGRTGISLNKLTQSCPGVSTVVGFQLFEAAGLPVPLTRYARLFVNGAYYNYTLEIESPGEDMLDRWIDARSEADPDFSETETPHLFKSGGCNCDEGPYGWGDERPLVDYCGWSAEERYAATYERKTWGWADHSELQALLEGLDAARASDDATLRAFLDENFDVDAVLAYMAVINWAVPFDDMFQNHYLVQRRSDGRWLMAPWDLDQDFGTWKGASASIYMGEEGDPDNRSGWWNRVKDSFFQVYRDEYDATLFALSETVLHPDAVSARVDAVEASWSLAEASAAPAGLECSFPDKAESFRSFARDRYSVVSALYSR